MLIRMRKATLSDRDDLFAWRNDDMTRAMALTPGMVAWEDHCQWLDATLARADRLLLIAEHDGAKAGVVRFDLIGEASAVISITIAPAMRGQKMARACLDAAITALQERHPEISTVIAEVKDENTASQRAFKGVGFILQAEADGVGRYERDLG